MYLRANREFHFLFYERCDVLTLIDRIRMLWLLFPWDVLLVLPERVSTSFDEHEAMLETVRQGDLDAVE